jgi:hypothetical protein
MRSALVALAVLLPAGTLMAGDITIDFGPSFGAPANGYVLLTDQLIDYGVVFSTTHPDGVRWLGGDYQWPPAQYSIISGPTETGGLPGGVVPIRVDFDPPVIEASVRGYDGGGDIDTLILNAYDSAGVLIDSDVITDGFLWPGYVATVSAADVAYITFEVANDLGDRGLFFDDLSFTVPEPATFGLLVFGGLMLRRPRRSP